MRLTIVKPFISFQYKSVLKDEWRQNKEMREHVKYGIYGGELTKDTLSLEHIKPHSKGGSNSLSNFALATKNNNEVRGNSSLKNFLTREMFEKYIEQFKGWTAKLFNNEEYIKNLTKTVEKQGVKL